MRNRFKDAIAIQGGACNPRAVARSWLAHMDAMANQGADTNTLCTDPALRLIAHQLAFLFNVNEIDHTPQVYGDLMSTCETKAKED
jgi:hypothetical protein